MGLHHVCFYSLVYLSKEMIVITHYVLCHKTQVHSQAIYFTSNEAGTLSYVRYKGIY